VPVYRLNGSDFYGLASQMLHAGYGLRFQASGGSMWPFILDGDILHVTHVARRHTTWGDLVLAKAGEDRLLVHRVVKTGRRNGIPVYLIKGDACTCPDGWFGEENIMGRVVMVEHGGQKIMLTSITQQFRARIWVVIAPWVPRLAWLPARFRRGIRKWLLGSLIPE